MMVATDRLMKKLGFYEDTVNPFALIKRDTEWGVFKAGTDVPVERGLTRSEAASRADQLNRQRGYLVEVRA